MFIPYVLEARSSLPPCPEAIDGAVIDDLGWALLQRLSSIGAPALLDLLRSGLRPSDPGTSDSTSYERFVASLTSSDGAALAEAFPVLGDLLDDLVQRWIRTATETLARIDDDLGLLTAALGHRPTISRSSGPLGDPHNGGASVLILTSSRGDKVVYKPRSLEQEGRVFDLIRWCHERADDPSFVPWVIDRHTHGWMEYVESASCSDPANYWRRAGRMSAALYVAGAVDLHNGNVLAADGAPVPIDLECVEQPILWQSPSGRYFGLDDTVVSTGLLPNHFTGDGDVARDVGGLLARRQQSGGAWLYEWGQLGTDAIDRCRRLSEWGAEANRPVDADGVDVAVDIGAFQRGFDEGSEATRRPDSPVHDWVELPARVLLRSTMIYMNQLATLTDTAALADRAVFAERVAGLPQLPAAVVDSLGSDALEAIDASETAALARLDIPLHRAQGLDLLLDGGDVVPSALVRAGSDRRRERIDWLCGPRLAAQRQLVRLAIEQHEGNLDLPPQQPLVEGSRREAADLIEAARAHAEVLVAQHIGTEIEPMWLEVDQIGHRRMNGLFHAADLYSGRAGIGVFFATLAVATGEAIWADWAQRCVYGSFDRLLAPWWESGRAGVAYAKLVVGDLLGDDELITDAEALLLEVLGERPTDDARMDLVGGWSGVLNSVLAFVERRPDTVLRAETVHLSEAMTSTIRRQLETPLTARGLQRAGFAHGVSGLGYSLQRAAVTLRLDDVAALADELVTFDVERTSARDGVAGRVDRVGRRREPTTSWCWGATGYLLARSSAVMRARVEDVTEHFDASLPAMCTTGRGPSHLCCGESGRLVMLDAVGRDLGSAPARNAADALAETLASEAIAGVPPRYYLTTTFDAPSLFWGRAGIGYALCRVARPASIPNILLVE
ncbi:MAG: type 2 lanthipeptide synthetase LanM [Acidimicrobiales bacterium]